MNEIRKSDAFKKPNPTDATHRAINIVVSIQSDTFFVLYSSCDGVEGLVQSKITVF